MRRKVYTDGNGGSIVLIEGLGAYVPKVELEALKAQVEQLRSGLNQAIELLVTALIEPEQITDTEISELRDIEQATPGQCLAEIKAQAGRDGFEAGYKKLWYEVYGTEAPSCTYKFSAENYANQLRQQAKAGEL